MKREHEDKKFRAEVETKDDPVLDCPEAWTHDKRLGEMCPGCNTLVPAGGAYPPAVVQRFFPAARLVQQPPPTAFPYSEEEAELMRQYETARQAFEDAAFEVDHLRQSGNSISGTEIRGGNVMRIDDAQGKSYQLQAKIEAAKVRRDKLRDEAQRILIEHNNLGLIRGEKHRRAILAESGL